ncbi:MAG: calcium/sodium antiporter [Sandaracinaceae bacterium]|nr:calcium/sodium antiporter [Sandaracinaceae bacterium]
MIDLAMLIGGGVLLYFGAEWLVGGAAGLARSMRVRPLLIGLTVVAYGTSAPEIVVGIQAAAAHHPDLALGNVLGSNAANLGLILGLSALLRPARVDAALRRLELPVLIGSTALLPLVLLDGTIHRWEGTLLLACALGYTAWMIRAARRAPAMLDEAAALASATEEAADLAGAPAPTRSRARMGLIAVVGLGVLILGGHLFVEGARALALVLGMTERLVGLTIVAVGTSLPELMTSLIAAKRGHSDIAIGNVVGSNIFNVLLCLGTAALVGEVGAPLASLAVDLGAVVGLTLLGALFLRSARLVTRPEAGLLLLAYLAFLAVTIARG